MLIISFNQIKLQKLHIPVPLYNHYYNYNHFQIKDVYLRYNHNHLELNVIHIFQLDFLLLLYHSLQSEAHNFYDDKLQRYFLNYIFFYYQVKIQKFAFFYLL